MANSHYIERRSIRNSSLSKDIAQHLYTRQLPGVVVVVVEKPSIFLSSLRKQWFAILRSVQRERSSTLIATRIRELNHQSMYMQRLPMTATPPDLEFKNGVFLVEPSQVDKIPDALHTIYLSIPPSDISLSEFYEMLPKETLVVLY